MDKINRNVLNSCFETMIYLIGSPPKCGKTTLSKKITKDYQIPWVSADTLQCIALAYIDKKEHNEKFPTRTQGREGNDEKYNDYSSKEIIDAYIKQGRTSYDATDMFAISEITEGNDYSIEGYQVTPELAKNLIDKYGKDKIKPIFLTKHDKQLLIENFEKSTTPNDWILTGTKDKKTIFPKIANMISEYSKYFEEEAKKHGFKVFNMDHDFNHKLKEAVEYLGIA